MVHILGKLSCRCGLVFKPTKNPVRNPEQASRLCCSSSLHISCSCNALTSSAMALTDPKRTAVNGSHCNMLRMGSILTAVNKLLQVTANRILTTGCESRGRWRSPS
jgi:hypothetical protein